MDKDLKDVIIVGSSIVLGYSAFLTLMILFVKDIHLIVLYTLILTIFIWLVYIQTKLTKIIKYKNNKDNKVKE